MKQFSLIILFMTILLPGSLFADGLIVVQPPPNSSIKQMGVKYHHVDCLIDNQVATTKIDQVFTNPNAQIIEGTYIFPLPDDAAVKKFTLYMNGKPIKGKVLGKDEALREYERIVATLRDPALLEYAGRGMFKARIFPIPANGEVRTTITYSQRLKADNDLVRYLYQLNTEKFSSSLLDEVRIKVRLKSDHRIKNIYSPSHLVDVVRISDREVVVEYEEHNVKPNKDFEVYYALDDQEIGVSLVAYRESLAEAGYFLLLANPSVSFDEEKAFSKDITFICDTSGSMSGKKIEQAKEALKFCLRNLNKGDRFRIIRFSSGTSAFSNELEPATKENVAKAVEWVDAFGAQGGTDIQGALARAFDVDRGGSNNPHVMFFMTDGLGNVAHSDPEQVLAQLQKTNADKAGNRLARLYCFGIGYDVNTFLLDGLAKASHASVEYVTPDQSIEEKVSTLYAKVASPVLSGLTISTSKNVILEDIFPRHLPDLFKGTQLALLGRYTGSGNGVIRLKGHTSKGEKEYVYEAIFPKRRTLAESIPLLWANAKVAYLVDQIRFHGETKEVREEIVMMSQQFGIITPYTSIIVLEDGEEDREGEKKTDALSAPARDSQLLKELKRRRKVAGEEFKSLGYASGLRAVSNATQQKAEAVDLGRQGKTAVKVDDNADRIYNDFKQVARQTQQLVQNRSFLISTSRVWVEADLSVEEIKTAQNVKYLSKEYFALLRANPDQGRFFALGQKVTFRLGSRVIAIR